MPNGRKYWRAPVDANDSAAMGSSPGSDPLEQGPVIPADIAAFVKGAPPAVRYPPVGAVPPGSPDEPLAITAQDWPGILQQILAGTPLKQLAIPLPELYPIPSATEFQQFDIETVTGVSTLVFSKTTLTLPQQSLGVIRNVNIFAGSAVGLSATTNLQFTIRINGAGAPGWTNRTFFPRVASSLEQPFDAFIHLPAGCTVDAIVKDVDGGTYQAGIWFTGWFWPVLDGIAWMQGKGSYGNW